jgi:cohesin complex subunit SCC1
MDFFTSDPGPSSSSRFGVRTPAKTEKSQATRKRRRSLLYNKQDYIQTERESQRRVRRKLTWLLFDDEGTVLSNE